MAFTLLIPARLGSTRLPQKALADISGKPLVVRVAEAAALAGAGRMVIATDAPEIARVVRQAGFEVVMTRADHPSGTDRLAEAADHLGLDDDHVVVNLQGDEPLMPAGLCRQVAAMLDEQPDLAMSTAAHPIHDAADFANPNVVKVVCDARGRALYFSRAPIPWARAGQAGWADAGPATGPLRHIGLYGYRVGFLRRFPQLPVAPLETTESLEQLRALWHGHAIGVALADELPGAGVDTPADLARVRQLFARDA